MIKLLEIHPYELKLAVSEIKYKSFSYFYNYKTSYSPRFVFARESYCHCKEIYLTYRRNNELNKVVFFKKDPFLKAKALWDSFGFEDFEFVEVLDQIAIEEKDNKLSSAKMDILITLVKSLDKNDGENDIYLMIDKNYGSKYPNAGSKYKFFIENKEELDKIPDASFKRSEPNDVGLLTIYSENYGV